MYFACVDESGNKDLNNKQNRLYVLVAVIIHEKGWDFLHRECNNLKQKIWDLVRTQGDLITFPPDFELHMKEISRKEGYYESIGDDDEKLLKIWRDMYLFISRLYIRIISIIIHKEHFQEQNFTGVANWAFKLLIERLNRYVTDKDPEQYIRIVIDKVDPKLDKRRGKEIEEFIQYGTGRGWEEYPEKVIETPFIVDSKIHNGVQLADIVAFLVRRYAMKYFGLAPNAFINDYCDDLMTLIESKFYRHNKYLLKGHGIMILPRNIHVDKQFWNVFYGYS